MLYSQKIIDLPTSKLETDERGFLWVRYKPGNGIELEDAKRQIACIVEMTSNTPVKIIIDASAPGIESMSTEVMQFFAANEDLKRLRICQAIVIGSLGVRLAASFYVKLIKPDYPIKLFNNEEDAVRWVLDF